MLIKVFAKDSNYGTVDIMLCYFLRKVFILLKANLPSKLDLSAILDTHLTNLVHFIRAIF